jgi:hypothetical protein
MVSFSSLFGSVNPCQIFQTNEGFQNVNRFVWDWASGQTFWPLSIVVSFKLRVQHRQIVRCEFDIQRCQLPDLFMTLKFENSNTNIKRILTTFYFITEVITSENLL